MQPASPAAFAIEVFADIACPWCYIGERHLDAALRQRPGVTVVRRWHPYLLNPDLPRRGVPWADFAAQKFGGADRARAMFGRVVEAGAAAGIAFDFERMPVAPNTRDAHRLIVAAGDRAFPLVDRLFRAYFEEAADVTDPDVLTALAVEAGMDAGDARRVVTTDAHAADVDRSVEVARRSGVQGVPLYLVGGRFALSGAQPVEVFVRALDRLAAG